MESLPSTHLKPVNTASSMWQPKMSLDISVDPLGEKLTLFENHWPILEPQYFSPIFYS